MMLISPLVFKSSIARNYFLQPDLISFLCRVENCFKKNQKIHKKYKNEKYQKILVIIIGLFFLFWQ